MNLRFGHAGVLEVALESREPDLGGIRERPPLQADGRDLRVGRLRRLGRLGLGGGPHLDALGPALLLVGQPGVLAGAKRLELVNRQLAGVEKQLEQEIACDDVVGKRTQRLARLKSVGLVTSSVLGLEFLWRDFHNRREVGGAVGLTGTPHQSGDMAKEQGVSKAGNRRVRAVIIEIAWSWLRYQPDSALSRWYQARFGGSHGRMRRIGIVALARRLVIALWRFAAQGIAPDGAILKPA